MIVTRPLTDDDPFIAVNLNAFVLRPGSAWTRRSQSNTEFTEILF